MPKRIPIRERAEALYDDPDTIERVVAHAEKMATTERIEAGELVLPGYEDANRWAASERAREEEESRKDATNNPPNKKVK